MKRDTKATLSLRYTACVMVAGALILLIFIPIALSPSNAISSNHRNEPANPSTYDESEPLSPIKDETLTADDVKPAVDNDITSSTEDSDIDVTDDNSSEHTVEEKPSYVYDLYFTEDDIVELATLVYLEAGGESYECQKGVASVVINRMVTTGKTMQEVIYQKNQFTPAYLIPNYSPSESTLKAVYDVLENGCIFPVYVTFFRANHYHNWQGSIEPYCCIDDTYFSADTSLMD